MQIINGHVGLAKRVFIFSVITKALRKLRDLLSKMTSTDTQIQNSLANIKGNLLTAFQPIYEVALPALKKLLLVLEQVTAFVAQFTAAMFGKSVAQMQKNAKALNKQATATSKVGKAAEKASRSLASFDELNQLSSNSDSSSDGGSSAGASMPSFDSDIGEMDAKIRIIITYGSILAGIALIMVRNKDSKVTARLDLYQPRAGEVTLRLTTSDNKTALLFVNNTGLYAQFGSNTAKLLT